MSLTLDDIQTATTKRGQKWGSPGLQFRGLEFSGESTELLEQGLLMLARFAEVSLHAGKTTEALKKVVRFQEGMAGGNDSLEAVKDELGDTIISAVLLANELGINLSQCVTDKFNKTSIKYGFPERLPLVRTEPQTGVASACRLN